MNFASKPKSISWAKIGFIALMLAFAGYKYYTANIAPGLADKQNEKQNEGKFSDDDYKVDFDGADSNGSKSDSKKYDIKFDPQKGSNKSSTKSGGSFKPNSNAPFLVSSGGRNKVSPEGLVYGMGGGGEHRTDHVLRHAKDQPSRPSHGVFTAQGDDVFRLVDEAYALVKSKSRQVKSENSRGNMAHVIDMKKKIGFKGGQSGKRANNPALYKVKLILKGKNVITAYPY